MPPVPADPSRRDLLRASSAALTAAVAGCANFGGGRATPELPNIEKRVIQRDQAAIVHIASVVTGTITWPEFQVIVPDAVRFVGTWESRSERLVFGKADSFRLEASEGTFRGTYTVENDRLTIDLRNGRTLTYDYTFGESNGTDRLELVDGSTTLTYERTAQGYDSSEVVEIVRRLALAPRPGGGTSRSEQEAVGRGSGFIVTPEGHVVTNAHVIGADEDPEKQLFIRLAADLNTGLRQGIEENFDVTEVKRDQIEELLFDLLLTYMVDQASVQGVTENHYVLNGQATPDEDLTVKSWDARVPRHGHVVVDVNGEPSWGRDVAVLQVNQSNLPSVDLGDASTVETGDELFVIGYPDIGIGQLFEERERTLEPTLTSGIVSARRELKSGINAIQTDAAINGGNSGGPMFDANGEVVGIATFSPTDYDIEQIEFGLPITVATDMLDALGVENRSGELDTAFDTGIEAYWRGDCRTAVAKMQRVLELRSSHPSAQRYIDRCRSGKAPGHTTAGD